MRNKLSDLNNYLFAQIERLDDEELAGDKLDAEIKRGNAIAGIATQIIANGNLQIKAVAAAKEAGIEIKSPALLMLTGQTE